VVLRAKELRVLRPHGHLLRTGLHLTPDESALTSTAWMNGVFHSMVTQGHVSINRYLSTVHSYLGVFRSHGLRVFAEIDGIWQLLDLPSAFHIQPNACHWIYRHATGTLVVQAHANHNPQELGLSVQILAGSPCRLLITQHIALNGDDGSAPGSAMWSLDKDAILVAAAPDSDVGRRFPDGRFRITPAPGTRFERVGGDELLFLDGRSRQQPFVCIISASATQMGLRIGADLIDARSQAPLRADSEAGLIPTLAASVASVGPRSQSLLHLADLVPWLAHNALVHFLSPRGLEQYSGGGWGTRDVCQGPVEMLLATGRVEPIRDLLLRVMRTQNPDGDWPQWFMFFERERGIRPGDSHGDIVFWPLLVLAQYLLVSGDVGVLDERVPFFDSSGPENGERVSVWEHAQRALALIENRVIPGTALAAYGHGDWNDSLQPADPRLRERLCSSWTVTLNVQVLTTLACALRFVGRDQDAAPLQERAGLIRSDFQRLLVVDGVLTGYALFEDSGVRYILHPRDQTTGVHFSSLGMIHALLEDLFTAEQSRDHLALIGQHLLAPDGIRLFDRPMPYHGGPQRIFQRAESATFFGREIGLMYMHAHLRYAQALAHLGRAEEFFDALCKANPIGICQLIPQAQLRQSNCYYSSSDAAFKDRDQASAEYERVAAGDIPLEGGWRVYSSGAGIALSLIMRYFLGLRQEADSLILDPVIPKDLDGVNIKTMLLGRTMDVVYEIGVAGCGVTAISLNDQALDFVEEPNPHRRGAARVSLNAARLLLAAGSNRLRIQIG
jgi:cellobiose phosphorylase